MVHEKLLEMIGRQIKVEDKAVEIYTKTAKMTDNAAIRLLMEEMAMDSGKHGKMYRTIEKVLKKQPYSFADFHEDRWTDKLVAQRELRNHIKMEEEMIQLLEEEIKITEQPTIKAILEHILQDEHRHHSVLKNVISQI
ncbi:MAG: ferritin family protein [Promethearchaeota archaeon]